MRGRPVCLLSCFMICLIVLLAWCGIPDRIDRTRDFLRQGAGEADPLRNWEEVEAVGRIVSLQEKNGSVTMRLRDVELKRGSAGSLPSCSVSSGNAPPENAPADPAQPGHVQSGHSPLIYSQSIHLYPVYSYPVHSQLIYSQSIHSRSIPTSLSLPDFLIQISMKAEAIPTGVSLICGNLVSVAGKLVFPEGPTCPGQFDRLAYADRSGVLFSLVSGRLIGWSRQTRVETVLERIRQRTEDAYSRVMEPEEAGTLAAITLGDRSMLSRDTEKIYREGGISHILAISGLHIHLVGMSIYRLLRKRRASFLLCAAVSCGLLSAYCRMTGMSSSAVRSTVMFSLWALSQVAGRTPDIPSSLSAAACLLLIRSPLSVFDGGFQLSFGCILSLHCLVPPLKQVMRTKKSGRFSDRLKEMLASSLAVTLGTLPILCWHFYQFSPYALVLNLVVLPGMSVLVLSGLLGACAGMLSIPAGVAAAAPCHYLLALFSWLCRLQRVLPGCVIVTGRPHPAQIGLYYAVLLLIAVLLRRKGSPKWLPVLLALNVLLLTWRAPVSFRLIFLDVGQGDCIIVQTGRKAFLVDGGSSSEKEVWRYKIEPCLKYYGIRQITAAFATHGDLDHMNGLEQMAETYDTTLLGTGSGGITVRRFGVSVPSSEDEGMETLRRRAESARIRWHQLSPGFIAAEGSVRLTVLHPRKKIGSGNEDSLVLLLEEKGGARILLTGDLERRGEEEFLRENPDLGQIDILKLGHHGSRNATSRQLLDRLKPKGAVVSCGRGNRYHHPAKETLERLKDAGVIVWRTDQQGTLLFERGLDGALVCRSFAGGRRED